ncbi:MAG: ComEC/Rec2 family competence protein, partial [Patescibacteria group bacterium]
MSRKLFTPSLVLILLFILAFIFRFEKFYFLKDDLKQFRDKSQAIELKGLVAKEPDIRINNTKLKLRVLPYSEYVLITTNNYPEYHYGDWLKIKGKLKTPEEYEGFNYKNYLKKDKILSVMYYPEIKILEKDQGNEIYAGILKIKEKLRSSVYRSLSSPQAELLAAMVLGDQSRLSEELKNNFNRTGITHIVAISGMNITIMAGILVFFFGLTLRLGWNRAFYLVLFITIFYIVMIGAPASAVRAGIMAGIMLLGQKIGRPYFALRALFVAGAAMLLFNPLLLFFDVGFQLSFLAVLGIIYLFPIFDSFDSYLYKFAHSRLGGAKFIKNSRWQGPRQLVAMTLSAQVFTLPILVYNFGSVSLVSPIVNVLVVPLLPAILVFGFLGIFA